MTGHDAPINSVSNSPDGRHIVTGSNDKTLIVWSAANGSQIFRTDPSHHLSGVWSVSYSPCGRHIASASNDGAVRTWSAATGKLEQSMGGHASAVRAICNSPNEHLVATGHNDGSVRIWDSHTKYCERAMAGHNSSVKCLAFSPCGRNLVTGGSGLKDTADLRVWHVETGRQMLVKTSASIGTVWCVSYSPDGANIAVGTDAALRVLDADTADELRDLQGQDPVRFVSYSPDGRHVAFATSTRFGVVRSDTLFVVASNSTTAFGKAVRISWASLTIAQCFFELDDDLELCIPDPAADSESLHCFAATRLQVISCLAKLRELESAWNRAAEGVGEDALAPEAAQLVSDWRLAHDAAASAAVSLQNAQRLHCRALALKRYLDRVEQETDMNERDHLRAGAKAELDAQKAFADVPGVLPLDELPKWLRDGYTLFQQLLKDLNAAWSSMQAAMHAQIAPLECGINQNAVAFPTLTVSAAVTHARSVLAKCNSVDALVEASVFVPMRRIIVITKRVQEEEKMEADRLREEAEQTMSDSEKALQRRAIQPIEKVGTTEAAALVVAQLSVLADEVHDSHIARDTASQELNKRAVIRVEEAKKEADANLAKATQRHERARTDFAALYRSKGHCVMSHYPEHFEAMLKLLPEPLRESKCPASQSLYDPTLTLADFDLLANATKSENSKIYRGQVKPCSYARTRCRDVTEVAIKEFKEAHAMVREVSVLKQAEKDGIENVARVLCTFPSTPNSGDGKNRYYMVMPWYEGGELHKWAIPRDFDQVQDPVNQLQRLSIAVQLSQTLAQLHERGTTHVDLKPQNVVIEIHGSAIKFSCKRYQPRLIDFGSSKSISGDPALLEATRTNIVSATVRFFPPEIHDAIDIGQTDEKKFKAAINAIDWKRVDVYCFGKVLESLRLCERDGPHQASSATTAELLALQCRMVNNRPVDRPAMTEVATTLSRMFKNDFEITCYVCRETAAQETACWCIADVAESVQDADDTMPATHVCCVSCADEVVRRWASHPIDPLHLMHRGELFCPCPDGSGGVCGRKLHVALKSKCVETLMNRVACNYGAAEVQFSDAKAMATVPKVKEAIAELFVIKCPACAKPRSIDFNDCLALTCGECRTMFCGYCLQLSPNSTVNHEHVNGHSADLRRHCGSTVPHHSRCAHRDSEPMWTCEPRWRRVWYETRIRAAVEALLKRLPDDGTRATVRREMDLY